MALINPREQGGKDVSTSRTAKALVTTVAALALSIVVPTAAQAAENPYERGPNPTNAILEASRGPFSTAQVTVSSLVSGFGGGIIYYPTDTSQGTFRSEERRVG